MAIENKLEIKYSELTPIFKEAFNIALDKAYVPKNIRENYHVSIDKSIGKIYISKK